MSAGLAYPDESPSPVPPHASTPPATPSVTAEKALGYATSTVTAACASTAVMLADLLLAFHGHIPLAMRLIAVASIVGGAAIFLSHGGRRVTAAGIYCLTAGLVAGSGAWYWTTTPPPGSSLKGILVAALSIYASTAIMYFLFWRGAAPKTNMSGRPLDPIPPSLARSIRMIGLLLSAVGVVGQRLTVASGGQSQGIGTLFQSAAEVGVILFAGSLVLSGKVRILRSPFRMLMVGAAVLVYYFFVFSGGGRLRLAALVISIAVLAQYRLHTRFKAVAIVALMPTLALFAAVGQARVATKSAGPATEAPASGLGSLVNPLWSYGQLVDGRITDGHGSTFIAEAVVLVPRTLWPNKPVQLGRTLAVRLQPDVAAVSNQSDVVMSQGEWYYNFSWLGIVLMIPILGWGIRWLDRRYAQWTAHDLGRREALFAYLLISILVGSMSDLAWGGTSTWAVRNFERLLVLSPFLVWEYLLPGHQPRRAICSDRKPFSAAGRRTTASPSAKRKIQPSPASGPHATEGVHNAGSLVRVPAEAPDNSKRMVPAGRPRPDALGGVGRVSALDPTEYRNGTLPIATGPTFNPTPLRRIGSRAVAAMVDQGFSSLTNFVVAFAALRYLNVAGLGEFTLAYFGAQLVLSIVRSLVLEPLAIRFTTVEPDVRRRATAAASGASVLIGLVTLALAGVPALTFHSHGWLVIGAAGVITPVLLVQDAWRFHLFAASRAWAAATNDAVCFVFVVPFTVLAVLLFQHSAGLFLISWGLGTSCGALLGMWQSRTLPRPRAGIGWLSRNRDLGPHLAIGGSLEFAASQAALAVIGLVGGVAATGQIGSGRTLMTPATTLTTGLNLFAVPEARRIYRHGRRQLVYLSAGVSLVVACGVAALAVGLYFTPDQWGEDVVGRNWPIAKSLLLPIAIWTVAAGARGGAAIGLRALERGRLIAILSGLTAPLIIGGVFVGVEVSGARGAAWGFAIVYGLAVVGWWATYLRAKAT